MAEPKFVYNFGKIPEMKQTREENIQNISNAKNYLVKLFYTQRWMSHTFNVEKHVPFE